MSDPFDSQICAKATLSDLNPGPKGATLNDRQSVCVNTIFEWIFEATFFALKGRGEIQTALSSPGT